MKKRTLYDALEQNILDAAGNVNYYAGTGDVMGNGENYGALAAYAYVLGELGHEAWIEEAKFDGLYVVESVTIDGEQYMIDGDPR